MQNRHSMSLEIHFHTLHCTPVLTLNVRGSSSQHGAGRALASRGGATEPRASEERGKSPCSHPAPLALLPHKGCAPVHPVLVAFTSPCPSWPLSAPSSGSSRSPRARHSQDPCLVLHRAAAEGSRCQHRARRAVQTTRQLAPGVPHPGVRPGQWHLALQRDPAEPTRRGRAVGPQAGSSRRSQNAQQPTAAAGRFCHLQAAGGSPAQPLVIALHAP